MPTSWEIERKKRYSKLESNNEADVVIIGCGLAGAWCAHFLSKAKKKVIVLERGEIGEGQTHYTTAFITQSIDTPIVELEKIFDRDRAQLIWQSGGEAIKDIERVVKEEKINCEFRYAPYFIFAKDEGEFEELEKEHKKVTLLGFKTRLHKNISLGFKHEGALEIVGEAKFHPIKFLYGLALSAGRRGAEIYEKTEVVKILGTGPYRVHTKSGLILRASNVIVATYDPFNNPKQTRFKKGMYTSYCMELEVPKKSVPEGMYIDLSNPYYYIRVDSVRGARQSRMIVGGEDHRSELKVSSARSHGSLLRFVKKTFPGLKFKVAKKWKGAIMESSDGVALIGEYAPGLYVATAFSGNGMTYSAIAGRLITDLILGRDNPYIEIYDPKRKMEIKALLYKARDYTGSFLGGAVRKFLK